MTSSTKPEVKMMNPPAQKDKSGILPPVNNYLMTLPNENVLLLLNID